MNMLYNFLNNRRAKDGVNKNMLSMEPNGKYYVARDEKSRFYNIYHNTIKDGGRYSILELQVLKMNIYH